MFVANLAGNLCPSFLGLANYYRDFIPNFAKIASSLYLLSGKSVKFEWTDDCQKSFECLKDAFGNADFLMSPDPNIQFYLETDASDFALGGVLSQKDVSGRLRPVGFYSRKFTAEINYDIHDKELLAIVDSLSHWCSRLWLVKAMANK